ncbi:superfamily II DNA/RNA helicase [Winogradskyella epiphytica]|uniref:Superfamily II DNA/RNA helicase n=1 Tax=Winogradskyella epiphytica TaxID=262005 RepID=A0A2V4XEZ2_9FLAO|nr:DEAD/DEAH box helicase [Winogradskyella epiphytica]PYE81625.1 superfamily II DNA/RNA helicase [Winogradskyella epiphytica]GGW63817.1 helicase [Winogradskyella epiphytica]
MAELIKSQAEILEKLNISELNPMQKEALEIIPKTENTILLSPTGTGKTLAFALPLIDSLDPECEHIQALILVPSRELAIQIEQVIRSMGSGYKVNAVYGGRAMSKDKLDLKHAPAILIGTPGRVDDHFANERFTKEAIKTLILDEFDKSLEVGFEYEMRGIIKDLTALNKRILTSATQGVSIPEFVGMKNPTIIDYSATKVSKLEIKTVISPDKSKLSTLLELLNHLGNQQGIVFCNLKDSIQTVSDFLRKHKIAHGCFNGGMEQKDRERSLIKFRNGTYQLLIATDLAARGIDVPEMEFIIHYELPLHEEEFIHRNGRTARVSAEGTAYVLKWKDQRLPEFIEMTDTADISIKSVKKPRYWETLFISGGRKDKISKGDIAGLFFKQGELNKDQLGIIELKSDCAFVAVPRELSEDLAAKLNNSRLKKKKVRVSVI